jgi:hypothetical protein
MAIQTSASMNNSFAGDTRKKSVDTPWSESLYKVNTKSRPLSSELRENFHAVVAKSLFATKRARQHIMPGIAYLCTRVQQPTEDDWKKIQFLKATKNDVLTLKADDSHVIKWYVDAAFAVHDDFKSHQGATMSLGAGAVAAGSTKQKVNTRSSTEAELVGLDDYMAKIMWKRFFLEAQGYEVKDNIPRQQEHNSTGRKRSIKHW